MRAEGGAFSRRGGNVRWAWGQRRRPPRHWGGCDGGRRRGRAGHGPRRRPPPLLRATAATTAIAMQLRQPPPLLPLRPPLACTPRATASGGLAGGATRRGGPCHGCSSPSSLSGWGPAGGSGAEATLGGLGQAGGRPPPLGGRTHAGGGNGLARSGGRSRAAAPGWVGEGSALRRWAEWLGVSRGGGGSGQWCPAGRAPPP